MKSCLALIVLSLLAWNLPAQSENSSIQFTELPAKNGGRIWVYLPANTTADAKLPCVIVPPAGSRLFHGMSLGKGDQAEHIPYAQAGFAVISFDISGPFPEGAETEPAVKKSLTDFLNAKLGVTDALDAVQVALAKFPQIDPNRLYIAGHSSAATLALQVAAASDPFKACVAFAPTTNIEESFGPKVLPLIEPIAPGISAAIHAMSPSNTIASYRCPLFLFHANDDDSVPAQSMITFRDALLAQQKTVEYVAVETGGHYDSMIQEGIPKAIIWLKTIDQSQPK